MRALDPRVIAIVWTAFEPLIPRRAPDEHPLGCHRPRIDDYVCFRGLVIRLATGCSYLDAGRICGDVSGPTLRRRRDEWIAADIFDRLETEALAAYDRIIGLDLSEVCIDGSIHKAPCGGEGTGRSPVDRGKLGWKWSVATDANGIPLGRATDGANRHDIPLLEPTLDSVAARGLILDIETLHLDRGYDAETVRTTIASFEIHDAVIARKRRRGEAKPVVPVRQTLGLRWAVERTNSWWSNYGQLRRNTDRRIVHRLAWLSLATVFMLAIKLLDWRDRYSS